MEAGGGGGLDVGHIFARLDAKLDDSNFKKFDAAVESSRAKAKALGSQQDSLSRSNDRLTDSQKSQVASLREQGDGWGSVARKLGVTGGALRDYRSELGKVDEAQKSHNKTTRETVDTQTKAERSTRDYGNELSSLEGILGGLKDVLAKVTGSEKEKTRTTEEERKETEKTRTSTRNYSRDLTGLDGSISRVNRVTTFLSKTMQLIKWPAMIAGAGAALQGLNALAAGGVGLISVLSNLAGTAIELPAILGTVGQAAGTGFLALMGVSEGVKALNAEQLKAGKDSETAAKKQRTSAASIASAQEEVISAKEGVRSATESLDDAERSEESSVRSLNSARHEAVKSLVDQRNAAIDARLAEQGSQLGLRRAVQELNKAETNPKSTMLEIEELELRVREARQGVKEAKVESARATNEAEKAKEQGVKKNPAVVEAERQLATARRGVDSANRGVSKSHREVQKAERGSHESMVGGNEVLNETNSALQKVHETFAELGPDQAKFARFLFGLKPDLKDLQNTAAKGFLPGAEKGIKETITNLPIVKRIIGDTSTVMGRLSERAGKLFGSKGFGHDLEVVGKGNAQTLGLMGRSAEHLFKALDNVMVVGQPLIKWIGKFTNQLTAGIDHATEKGREDGGLASFFEETEETVETLFNTLGNLGGFLGVVLDQAKPLGKEILDVFETSSEGLDKWAHSAGGENSIARYFKDAKEPLWEAGRLVHDIVTDFFEMGDGDGMKSITKLLHALRVELLPIFKNVTEETSESFGPHLIELLTQVLGLFGRLSGTSGPLTMYVEALTAAGKVTNFLLDDIPGLKGVTTNLLGIVGVMKTIEGLGKFTGITKGLELAFGDDFGGKLKGKLKSQIGGAVKSAFATTSNEAKYAFAWGHVVAEEAAEGIGRQVGKFKAVARKAVIAFIGTFAPEMAAEMAASGSVGQVLSDRFPKLAGLFKGGGKMAGKAFVVGTLLGAVLIGVELGNLINKKFPNLGPSVRHWGIHAGEAFVNGLIDAVNLGIKGINKALDKANVLSFLGVEAPNIGEVGHVNWHSSGERHKEAATQIEKETGRTAVEGKGGKPIPSQSPAEIEKLNEELRARRRGGKKPEDEAADTRKKVTGEHKKLRKEVEGESEKQEKNVLEHYSKTRKGASEESRLLDKAVSSSFLGTRGSAEDSTAAIAASTSARFEEARSVAVRRSQAMAEGVEHNVKQMNHATAEGMDHIQKSTERALKAFGVKDVKLELRGGGKELAGPPAPQKKAEGGVFTVPGQGLQDTVYMPSLNAMVAPGENIFASNRHQTPLLDYAVDMAFGTPDLDSFFATYNTPHWAARGGDTSKAPRRPRRYARGGEVVLDPGVNMSVGQEPKIYKDLRALAGELGKVVYVISGYRSPQHSVEVGGFANDPHTRGEAADIGVGSPTLASMAGVSEAALKAVGLWRPYVSDPAEINHVQLLAGGAAGTYTGTVPGAGVSGTKADHIKAPRLDGAGKSTFGALAQTALDRTTKAANKYIDRQSATRRGGFGGLNVSVPSGPIEKMAREMVSQIWGPSQFPAFAAVEEREAGWNPRAENPSSGAAGLAQALPASKYPPGAWPYTGPSSAKLQLEWMVQYIKERYGTPSGALAHEESAGWYARGGRIAQRLAGGGAFKGNINRTWPGAVFGTETAKWEALPKLPPYVGAALAEAAGKYTGTGMPGWTMEQVSLGEGDLKPGSRSTDDGWGWLAITRPFGDSFGVPQMGGYEQMLNPVKNAYVAARMWGGNPSHFGPGGTWHGSSHVTDENKHYTGTYDLRDALGGHSFKEALEGRSSAGPESKGSVPSLKPELSKATRLGPKKRRARIERGLEEQRYASKPRGPGGKYSPKALMRLVAETGISLPYGLAKWGDASGGPNWQGLSVSAYRKLADSYYAKVAEYRARLGEERKSVEEGFASNPVSATLPSVTSLSAATIATALGYHSPAGPEASAYEQGYGALAAMDAQATQTRTNYQSRLLGTYSESSLAPYRHKESIAEYNRENALAEVNNELGSKSYAQAKLKGLRARLKAMTAPGRPVKPKKKRTRSTPNPNKKKTARRRAQGGRLAGSVARRFAKGGTAKKVGLSGALPAGQSAAKARAAAVKKTHAEIRRHTEKVAKRAASKTKRAEQRYEEESEGILSPLEREREEIEEQEQEREAYEQERREMLAPLLNELAANVQRTALVGASQASILGLPSFARGGQMKGPATPAAGSAAGGAGDSHVHVPLAIHMDSTMSALNPHIEAIVDDRINKLGVNAGTARATVSAPGRRVSYGGK